MNTRIATDPHCSQVTNPLVQWQRVPKSLLEADPPGHSDAGRSCTDTIAQLVMDHVHIAIESLGCDSREMEAHVREVCLWLANLGYMPCNIIEAAEALGFSHALPESFMG